MQALRYFFSEAASSLARGWRAAFLSVITTTVAMGVLSGLLLTGWNVDRVLTRISATAELSVYLDDEVTDEEREDIERLLEVSGLFDGFEYVSKEEAASRFERMFPELAPATATTEIAALPASIEARLVPGTAGGTTPEHLARDVSALPGVADVRYDQLWLERLASMRRIARALGIGLVGVLVLASGLTVASVVRLALSARRDEVEILEFVGAPIYAIRGPFIVEGMLHGGAGAVLALLLVGIAYLVLRTTVAFAVPAFVDPPLMFLPVHLCVLLLALGMLVGCAGGLIAAWNVPGSAGAER
jgi:cell division transport system permease protein